jgi:hypothetical protein
VEDTLQGRKAISVKLTQEPDHQQNRIICIPIKKEMFIKEIITGIGIENQIVRGHKSLQQRLNDRAVSVKIKANS